MAETGGQYQKRPTQRNPAILTVDIEDARLMKMR